MSNQRRNIVSEIDLSRIHIPIVHKVGLPNVQSFNINKLKQSSQDIYNEESLTAIMNKIENADAAFLNSILSYSCYKDKLWTLEEINKDLSDMTVRVEKAMRDEEEFYKLKIWHFNKSFFKPINQFSFLQEQGRYKSTYGFDVSFTFKNGQYSAMDDLAHASVLTSAHPSGEGNVLHVAFRGTDFARLPAFIISAYPDMTAYYQQFLPLEKAILKYARDPKNNIKEIQVSGHSLGGAMVQEFLNRNQNDDDTPLIKGFTYGSPGAKKNLFVKFLNIGYHLIKHQTLVIEKEQKHHDERLNEFYHSNDPVPKIGLLGYKRNGTAHNLFDKLYEDSKEANLESSNFLEKVPLFGKMITYFKENICNKLQVRFHDSKRYTLNIKGIIDEHYKLYPYMSEDMNKKTAYWQSYLEQEKKFSYLSIRYKSAFEKLFKDENPNLNNDEIQEKLLNMRAKMRYDSEAHRVLSEKSPEKIRIHYPIGDKTSNIPSEIFESVNRLKNLREKYGPIISERSALFKKV